MPYRVGTKGRIVIEKELRDQLGIKPGWLTTQAVVDGHVEIYFIPPIHRRSLKGSLREYAASRETDPDQDWSDVRSSAWSSATLDRRFPATGVTVAADLGTP